MGWLDLLFGKKAAKDFRKIQKVAKATHKALTPPKPAPVKPPIIKWGKSTNGHDQAEIDGFRVTIFKHGDFWNYCVVEILDEDDIADGMEEDPIFGDDYPTKAEARREALTEIGYYA